MDDTSENSLKTICCTCLCTDRSLTQLCKIKDGVNNLYVMLSQDPEAYREGFYKDVASLRVCWECQAVMKRIMLFKSQACTAQKLLTSFIDNQLQEKPARMSCLEKSHKNTYDKTFLYEENNVNCDVNFIDCGLAIDDVKSEDDSDSPLAELIKHYEVITESIKNHNSSIPFEKSDLNNDEQTPYEIDVKPSCNVDMKPPSNKRKKKKAKETDKECFSMEIMSQKEMQDFRNKIKLNEDFIGSLFKCEPCVIGFKDEIELNDHNSELHTEKPNHTQCDVCACFVKTASFLAHQSDHFRRYKCNRCEFSSSAVIDIHTHVKEHTKKYEMLLNTTNKGRVRRNSKAKGFLCTECNQTFKNSNQKWKHVQRFHREGFRCSVCDKRFPFKNDVTRHETIHKEPLPREECPTCKKSVRCDLMKIHLRTHGPREKQYCVQCDRWFASRASYHYHLVYSDKHATRDVVRYKCDKCGKGYRSRGELRDHINYRHNAKTQHKCPICHKGLATPRCLTRHIKRLHQGIKESAKDKICQQCGKAFRDKKCLREHEMIHSGCRPLSCELCGGAFRQSAALYTHRRRVHKILATNTVITVEEAKKP